MAKISDNDLLEEVCTLIADFFDGDVNAFRFVDSQRIECLRLSKYDDAGVLHSWELSISIMKMV